MSPFVSVIVPNYNHAAFLHERIKSILNQTFQDFEIIILDDCSTDHSKEIIEHYRSNPKVSRVVYNEPNSGNTFIQWTKGISLAKGEFVWIAESDDYCEVSLLAELVTSAKKYEGCVVSFCQTLMFRDNEILWRTGAKLINECVSGEDFVKNKMLLGNEICNASMAIFKRDTFDKVDNEMFKYKLSGDWTFWVQICLQGNVAISGKYLNYFRKHPKDISTDSFKNGLLYIEYFKLLEFFTRLKLVSNNSKNLLKLKYKQFVNDIRISKENKKAVTNLFREKLGNEFYSIKYKNELKLIVKKCFKLIFKSKSLKCPISKQMKIYFQKKKT